MRRIDANSTMNAATLLSMWSRPPAPATFCRPIGTNWRQIAVGYPPGMEVTIRRARTADVRGIRRLVDRYATGRRLLSKATVALFEDVPEFWVAVDGDGAV